MKKFVFTLERMLAYQEQNLEKEKGILARIMAERDKLEEDRRDKELRIRHIQEDIGQRQIQGQRFYPERLLFCAGRSQNPAGRDRDGAGPDTGQNGEAEARCDGGFPGSKEAGEAEGKTDGGNTAMKRQRSSRILLSSMLQEHLSGMAFPK